jgi:hypothetical protein
MNAQPAHGKRAASSGTDYTGVLSSVVVFRAADGAAFRFVDFHDVNVIKITMLMVLL